MQVEELLASLVHRPAEEIFGHVVVATPRAMEGLRRVLRRLHRDVAAGVARADDEDALANERLWRLVLAGMHLLAGELAGIVGVLGQPVVSVADDDARVAPRLPRTQGHIPAPIVGALDP